VSAAVTVSALAELDSRAGASDANREVWLAERRAGITATEVKDLYLGKVKRQDLIGLKLGLKKDTFSGNVYTEWGKAREPVIAEAALTRYGIRAESRVFHAADNPRFLASPDGVGINFDEELEIAEYKTSGKPIGTHTKAYADTGYRIQKMWGMRVTGARRCLYGHETRLPDGEGGFKAGPLVFEWVEYDEALAAELEEVAVEFLAELDKQRDGDGPVIDEQLDTWGLDYLRGADAEKQGIVLKKSGYDAIYAEVSGDEPFLQESPMVRISFSPGKTKVTEIPDKDAAIAAAPELHAELLALQERWSAHAAGFTKTVEEKGRAVLRITPGKGMKE
jgi:hypothetical protein